MSNMNGLGFKPFDLVIPFAVRKASSQREAGIERRQGKVTLTQQTSGTMSHLEEWKRKKRQEKAGEEEPDN